jgi:hypothetical protein
MIRSAYRRSRRRALPLLAAFAIASLALIGCESEIYHGRIAVKGNEPFTYVALVEQSGREFTIAGPLQTEIRERYQGRYLKVRARILDSGRPLELEVLEVLEARDTPF